MFRRREMDKENILVWRHCKMAGESSGLVE